VSQQPPTEPREYDPGNRVYMIVTESISDRQRNLIHEFVKDHAVAWWHHFANVWIVTGHSVRYWTENIKPLVEEGPAQMFVFRLQRAATATGKTWSGYADSEMYGWLEKHLRQDRE
jgi:hypothetical protein